MKKITSFAVAAFAAITITASGYAENYVTYDPTIVYLDSETSSVYADDNESGGFL